MLNLFLGWFYTFLKSHDESHDDVVAKKSHLQRASTSLALPWVAKRKDVNLETPGARGSQMARFLGWIKIPLGEVKSSRCSK